MVDTVIRLFESTATDFTTLGLGGLSDAISCQVDEERNGQFELTMQYPIDGRHFNDLTKRRLILAKPNPFDNPQPFRIYAISKPINGVVTINAEHISYDLSGYVVNPFEVGSVVLALAGLKTHSLLVCPFEFWTDKNVSSTFTVTVPSSIRSLLGGVEGSILDVYGKGEYEFDKFNVKLWTNRGANNGVSIRYGKNLTNLKQEESCSNVYTAVYPYWYSEEIGLITLSEFIVRVPGTFNYDRIMPLDLSSKWQDPPTEADLRSAASEYITDNGIGIPKVSIDVSFIQLAQSDEYKDYALLETVRLCDTVNVEFPKLGVSATSKCVKTSYNVITDKYISLELGEASTNLAKTISSQSKAISKRPDDSNILKAAVNNATKLITGGLGGYVILHSSSGDPTPDEILIMNTADIETATKVWRWNKDGLGYSSTGYDGDFGLAMTSDGEIVADFIKTGTLSANRISGGVLTDEQGYNYWDLSTGEFRLSWNSSIGSGQNETSVSDLITSVEVQYAQGDSAVIAPTSGWSTNSPTWTPTKYIWQRTVTTKGLEQEISNVACIQGARGTNVLRITTAPSTYTTVVDGFTPRYRIALATVESQSGDTPKIGDIIERNYYHYPVGLIKDGYVYLGTASSIRGAKGDAGEDAPILRIDSSRGTVFKNNQISTVLSVTIYVGGERITNQTDLIAKYGAGAYLQWYWLRISDDEYGIIVASDTRLSNNGFSLTIGADDVDTAVTFRCELITE